MSLDRIKRNKEYIRNIYRKGPFQGHAFSVNGAITPVYKHPKGCFTLSTEPVAEWLPWAIANYRSQLDCFARVDHDGVPQVHVNTGTHIYAAAFGCRVKACGDNNPFALPILASPEEADRLSEPDIWKSPTIYRIFELAEAIRKELGPETDFGPCDMQTGFDTAALIWNKEDLFCAMCDPVGKQAVKRLVDKCARFLRKVIMELRKEFPTMSPCHYPPVWSPPEMAPWVSNDECGSINTEMFEEFCLPELQDLSSIFGGLGMHCCADAEHQFPGFARIKGFYAFNRIPARQGIAAVFPLFGGPDGPVLAIAGQEVEAIEELLRQAPSGTRFIFDMTGGSLEASQRAIDRLRAI
jgi:hypothetical protein